MLSRGYGHLISALVDSFDGFGKPRRLLTCPGDAVKTSRACLQQLAQKGAESHIYILYIMYNKIGSTFFGEWNGLKPESEHDKHSQIINSALRSESKNPPFPGLKSLAWTAPGMP